MFSKRLIFKIEKKEKDKVSHRLFIKVIPFPLSMAMVISLSHWHWAGPWICFGWWDSTNMMQRLGKKIAQQSHPLFCYSWDPCNHPRVNRGSLFYDEKHVARHPSHLPGWTFKGDHPLLTVHSCMSEISVPCSNQWVIIIPFWHEVLSRFRWLYLFGLG